MKDLKLLFSISKSFIGDIWYILFFVFYFLYQLVFLQFFNHYFLHLWSTL